MEIVENIKNFLMLLSGPLSIIAGIIIVLLIYRYLLDLKQSQHSILRTHPIMGWARYMLEQIGEEFRQYWFYNSKENRPMDRDTQTMIAYMGKYLSTTVGEGVHKDFSGSDLYLKNSMFAKNENELEVDNSKKMSTRKYQIDSEGLFLRKEHTVKHVTPTWYLKNPIVIGKNSKNPWDVKGLLGISAMSYGALSKEAVKALSQGAAISGGTWMNTGEGGISPFHLSRIYEPAIIPIGDLRTISKKHNDLFKFIQKKELTSNFELEEEFGEGTAVLADELVEKGILKVKTADLIFQIGSGMNGAQVNGTFSYDVFKKNATKPEVKAVEIKIAQGAKVKGGHVEASKVTPEIAAIRGVEPYKAINSPNRFSTFHDVPSLIDFVERLKKESQKPVGIKVVIGGEDSLEEIAAYMAKTGKGPDFITVDGSEGGSGAAFYEMATTMGLPIYTAIMIADNTLRKYGLRDDVKIIASGMLATADKMALALAMGADMINVARAAMNAIGCINAMKCHTNKCPVGVTTHDPKLTKGLVVTEKRFRVANYLTTARKNIFALSAACGVDCPTKLERGHVTYRDQNTTAINLKKLYPYEEVENSVSEIAKDIG
jgi:glutamate synthase domain-containing protein 2